MTVAITVGLLMFGAVYLFSKRELLRVILGMVLLGHAGNLAILAAGGTVQRALPFIGNGDVAAQADPLPQAFVLTAIVISFAVTVLLLVLAVTGRSDDQVADPPRTPTRTSSPPRTPASRAPSWAPPCATSPRSPSPCCTAATAMTTGRSAGEPRRPGPGPAAVRGRPLLAGGLLVIAGSVRGCTAGSCSRCSG